jgi:hypothetical protein
VIERLKIVREWLGTPLRAVVTIIVALVLSSLIVTALDRRSPVVVVAADPMSDPVRPGGEFNGHWTVQVNRVCSAVSHRWLQSVVDPTWIVSLPPIEPNFRDGTSGKEPELLKYPVTTFEVPVDAPLGEMSYHSVVSFTCWHWGDALFPINITYPPMIFIVADGQSSS